MNVDLPPVFLCPEAATDRDADGVCDMAEMKYTTDPDNVDSDGDFLGDNSELYGYRTDDGKLLDLPGLKASPKHRDVFLYIDYYAGRAPAKAAVSQVVSAFAAAPIENLDGKPGINLHVKIAGKAVDPMLAAEVLGWPELAAIKNKHFDKTLTYAYHYVVFAKFTYAKGSTVSGMSPGQEAASDFVVSLGGYPRGGTALQQAGTLMHELGHNLGLDHGGYTTAPGGALKSDETTDKPHYLSVMNYAYQMNGFIKSGKRVLDYARHPVGPLSEQAVSEPAALNPTDQKAKAGLQAYTNLRICTLAVKTDEGYVCDRYASIKRGNAAANLDWNRNRRIDRTPLAINLDGDDVQDQWNGIAGDWALLKYFGLPRTGERAGNPAIGDLPIRTCMTLPTVEEEPEPAPDPQAAQQP